MCRVNPSRGGIVLSSIQTQRITSRTRMRIRFPVVVVMVVVYVIFEQQACTLST